MQTALFSPNQHTKLRGVSSPATLHAIKVEDDYGSEATPPCRGM